VKQRSDRDDFGIGVAARPREILKPPYDDRAVARRLRDRRDRGRVFGGKPARFEFLGPPWIAASRLLKSWATPRKIATSFELSSRRRSRSEPRPVHRDRGLRGEGFEDFEIRSGEVSRSKTMVDIEDARTRPSRERGAAITERSSSVVPRMRRGRAFRRTSRRRIAVPSRTAGSLRRSSATLAIRGRRSVPASPSAAAGTRIRPLSSTRTRNARSALKRWTRPSQMRT
jgi:hypothetical protein